MSSTLKGLIKDPRVKLAPSRELLRFIHKHINAALELPQNISWALKRYGFNIPATVDILTNKKTRVEIDLKYLRKMCTENQSLEVTNGETNADNLMSDKCVENSINNSGTEPYFNLADLHWLSTFFRKLRKNSGLTCYLHEFITTCELVLPKNETMKRNPILEARCTKLREEQQNRAYHKMTKNVDSVLKNYPEDTIAYQMKAINSQIIAVLQFVLSVVAGFVFGFLGVELVIGNLEFGFRLLLGIICALIIALAEIYFLAKKLNEIDDAVTSPPKGPSSPYKDHKLHND